MCSHCQEHVHDNNQGAATLTTWKALRIFLLLCILLVLSLTLTRELGSFSRLIISAFGSSVLLLLSARAGQLCLDLQIHITFIACQEATIVTTAGRTPHALQCRNSTTSKLINGQNILEVTSSLAGRRFLLSLRACLAGRGGLRAAGFSSSCSSGLAALNQEDSSFVAHTHMRSSA